MNKIRIKNFGPIKEGCLDDDGWLDIKKVTVFIGNQGSGKSTVAKLISTMTWIEKAMVKGVLRQEELNTHNRFAKQLAYQRIESYLRNDTYIEYQGKAFSFKYINGGFSASKSEDNGYLLPKIMYAPAERNFLSVVDRPNKVKNLPSPLYTFNDEYDKAKRLYADGIDIPINGVRFEYDKLNQLAHIVGPDNSYRLRLSEASSGFQSTIPLYLVTKCLSDSLSKEEDFSEKEESLEDQKKLEKEIKLILEDNSLTSEIKQFSLRQLSAKRKPACFINVVEEPEQNLFPSSQHTVLNELLKYVNAAQGNKLVMTTHSPYLINYLTLAVKAATLNPLIKDENTKQKLNNLVPLASTVNPDDLAIYELDEKDGTIKKLGTYHGLPSDENELNLQLGESNELFAQVLEIQQQL